jgi:hypothetical protein
MQRGNCVLLGLLSDAMVPQSALLLYRLPETMKRKSSIKAPHKQ